MKLLKSRIIQIVWFPKSVDGLDAAQLFQKIVGEEADTFQKNKAASSKAPYLSLANGNINNLDIAVQIAPGRVDYVLSGHTSEEGQPPHLPLISTQKSLEQAITSVQTNAANCIGDVTRLSIITSLNIPSANLHEANAKLLDLCSIPIDATDLSDLNFQINRPKNLENGVRMNRVVTYSVERAKFVRVEIVGGTERTTPQTIEDDSHISVLIRLDFNTVPSGVTIAEVDQYKILKAISKETLRFAEDCRVQNLEEN